MCSRVWWRKQQVPVAVWRRGHGEYVLRKVNGDKRRNLYEARAVRQMIPDFTAGMKAPRCARRAECTVTYPYTTAGSDAFHIV
jgi:hypothetical protein